MLKCSLIKCSMLKRINCESAQSIFVGRKKNSDKIEFLVKKWKCREEVPEHYRGIIISSEKLKTKYDEPVIGKRAQSSVSPAKIYDIRPHQQGRCGGSLSGDGSPDRSSGGGGPWPEEEAGCSGEDTIQWVHSMRTPGKTTLRVWSHIIPMIEWLVWRKNNWLRNLEVGEAHGHWDRVKSALKNKDCHVPVLYGMVKDHKPRAPGAQPKMRSGSRWSHSKWS